MDAHLQVPLDTRHTLLPASYNILPHRLPRRNRHTILRPSSQVYHVLERRLLCNAKGLVGVDNESRGRTQECGVGVGGHARHWNERHVKRSLLVLCCLFGLAALHVFRELALEVLLLAELEVFGL